MRLLLETGDGSTRRRGRQARGAHRRGAGGVFPRPRVPRELLRHRPGPHRHADRLPQQRWTAREKLQRQEGETARRDGGQGGRALGRGSTRGNDRRAQPLAQVRSRRETRPVRPDDRPNVRLCRFVQTAPGGNRGGQVDLRRVRQHRPRDAATARGDQADPPGRYPHQRVHHGHRGAGGGQVLPGLSRGRRVRRV